MLIYNLTLKIEWTIQQQWLAWMQQTYLPRVMQSGCFTKHQLVRLLEIDEDDGPTYALQLYAANRDAYNLFRGEYLPHIERMSDEKWGNGVFFFGTLMEIVE